MDNRKNNKQEENYLDLKPLAAALLRKAWLIAAIAVVCAAGMFVYTALFVAPEYQSSAMFYVNNSSLQNEASNSISSADISASRNLVQSYITILNTPETMEAIAQHAGVDYSYVRLMSMIHADAVDSTAIFKVVVTADNPVEAQQIADGITKVLPERISSIIDGTSARVVAAAVLPKNPSSPSYPKNVLLGFLGGLVLSSCIIILKTLLDVTVHTKEDIEQICNYPILAEVPDLNVHSGEKSYYPRGRKKGKTRKSEIKQVKPVDVIGDDISFSASEAYKLLRTKLQFFFSDESNSHVIGVCSTMAGEGKSLTAVNLAYTVAQLGKNVLLIDCDMRRPSVGQKLSIKSSNGLSTFLAGQTKSADLVHKISLKNDEKVFHVILSGKIPPNPVELLSSPRMVKTLELLREKFEYIILDLPPIGEVSDALAVAGQTDGIVMVVRQNYCDRSKLSEALRQFDFADSRILGIVFNVTEESSSYYSDSYSKPYRKYAASEAKQKNRKI